MSTASNKKQTVTEKIGSLNQHNLYKDTFDYSSSIMNTAK